MKQAVTCALEAGYRHIDCAAIYGNETEIGEALQEMLGPSKVKMIILETSASGHLFMLFLSTYGGFWSKNLCGAHQSDRVDPSASETRGRLHHLQTVEHPASPRGRGACPPEDAEGSPAGVPGSLPHPLAPRFPVSSITNNNWLSSVMINTICSKDCVK